MSNKLQTELRIQAKTEGAEKVDVLNESLKDSKNKSDKFKESAEKNIGVLERMRSTTLKVGAAIFKPPVRCKSCIDAALYKAKISKPPVRCKRRLKRNLTDATISKPPMRCKRFPLLTAIELCISKPPMRCKSTSVEEQP